MKSLIIILGLGLVFSVGTVQAESARSQRASGAQETCVYKYLSCRDTCDYNQDASQIEPCKVSCDRKFSCRPKKAQHSIGDNEGE